jgi:APA family basic amino acid/polyamine antiporter
MRETPGTPAPTPARVLGLRGAVTVGLGAMLGTGLFVGLAHAAARSGPGLAWAIIAAGGLAALNGLAVAQLAAAHPESGGAWAWAGRNVGPAAGFSAGWLFLCAKSASCATAALGLAAHVLTLFDMGVDGVAVRALAAALTLLVTALAASGLKRSARVNAALVSVTIGGLGLFVAAALTAASSGGSARLAEAFALPLDGPGFLGAIALCFVAFAGYARVATLGEEVEEPSRTLPRALLLSLGLVAALSLAVTLGAVTLAGVDGLAAARHDDVPLARLAETHPGPVPAPLVVLSLGCSALAALGGVTLNLILGLSRVAFAMGRGGDLPRRLGTLDATGSPRAAVMGVGAVVAALTLIGETSTTWAFSAFSVLGYYGLTHLAAWRQPASERRLPRGVHAVGLVACASLAWFVPPPVWALGLGLIAAGLTGRWLARRRSAGSGARAHHPDSRSSV